MFLYFWAWRLTALAVKVRWKLSFHPSWLPGTRVCIKPVTSFSSEHSSRAPSSDTYSTAPSISRSTHLPRSSIYTASLLPCISCARSDERDLGVFFCCIVRRSIGLPRARSSDRSIASEQAISRQGPSTHCTPSPTITTSSYLNTRSTRQRGAGTYSLLSSLGAITCCHRKFLPFKSVVNLLVLRAS